MYKTKIHRLVHLVESLRRNGNCDETNGAMFENVTAQTREDAQGNFHNPALDMLRGSMAMDKLRQIAVLDVSAGGISAQLKGLLTSMPVTRQLLHLRDAVQPRSVKSLHQDTTRSIRYFSAPSHSGRTFGFYPAAILEVQGWMSVWSLQFALQLSNVFLKRLSLSCTLTSDSKCWCCIDMGRVANIDICTNNCLCGNLGEVPLGS